MMANNRFSTAVLLVLVSVLFCEALLFVAAKVSPLVDYHLQRPWTRRIIADDVLGKRVSPYHPGNDHRGYRNSRELDRADVLGVGDSMTYGYGAGPEGSWPSQLGRLTGLTVYNAGVGSYSPPEYEVVIGELLELDPRVVVLGLYLANDISGAFQTVYVDQRLQHLLNPDLERRQSILELQASETLRDQALRLGMSQVPNPRGDKEGPRPKTLAEWSSLYRLGRYLQFAITQRLEAPLRRTADDSYRAASGRPGRLAFDGAQQYRTVFSSPQAGALAMDLTDPRIREGLRITQEVLRSIQSDLNDRGLRFVVLLLPSKRLAYEGIVRDSRPDFPADFFRSVEMEKRLAAEIRGFLEALGISYVDPLPSIRAAFAERGPYHESDDGHPNELGYGAIAAALVDSVRIGE